MVKLRRVILFFLLSSFVTPIVAIAQNNPYKINDNVFAYYAKCYKVVREKKVIAMVDTMFTMAGKLHDVKGQCISLVLKCIYYTYTNDIPALNTTRSCLYKFSSHTPYTQYIFNAWNMYINCLLKKRDYKSALSELMASQKEAYRMNDEYGIGQSFIKLGDCYFQQSMYDKSIVQYQKGIDYFLNTSDKKNQAYDAYHKISLSYTCLLKYPSAIDNDLLFLSKWPVKQDYGKAYLNLACCYYSLGKIEEGNEYSDKYFKWEKQYRLSHSKDSFYYLMLINYHAAHKDYNKALLCTDSLNDSILSFGQRLNIYKAKGDYKRAFENYVTYTKLLQKQFSNNISNKISEYTALFDNEKLKSEKNALALKNSSLQVKQLQSAQQMLQLDRQRKGLELSNVHLELNNKNLKLLNQYQEMLKQKAETERLREKARSSDIISQKNRSIATLLALVLAIITISSFVYILLRRKVEQQLKREKVAAEQAREEAERADRLKTLFLQNMSHEIRTPLNAIVGFSSIMAEQAEELDEKTKADYIGLISNNTDQLTTLINDILDLSSLESGYYKVNYEDVDLNDLCSQAIESVKGREKEGVALRFDAPYDSLTIRTDHVRTSQVITNFLTNACKYTDEGSITLTYERQDENVVISVTDTGRGIDIANADKIFNRFEKLDSFVQGTGIGLNICLRIAQLLHGEVKLDTSYKGGSRFLFVIPTGNG